MDLTKKKCEPCEGGIKPFDQEEIKTYMSYLKTPWHVKGGKGIEKVFRFKDFREAIKFINKVADIAEDEDHHPNILINYSTVKLSLWTHAIGGLSVNDFILASKIDAIK